LIEETKEKRKKKDLEREKAQLMQKEIDLGRVVSSLLLKLEKESSVVLDSEKKTNLDEKILTKGSVEDPADIIRSKEALEKREKILEESNKAQKIEEERLKATEEVAKSIGEKGVGKNNNKIPVGPSEEISKPEQEKKGLSLRYSEEEIPVIKLEEKVPEKKIYKIYGEGDIPDMPEKEENPTTPGEEGETIKKLKNSIKILSEEYEKQKNAYEKLNPLKRFFDPFLGDIGNKRDAAKEMLEKREKELSAEIEKEKKERAEATEKAQKIEEENPVDLETSVIPEKEKETIPTETVREENKKTGNFHDFLEKVKKETKGETVIPESVQEGGTIETKSEKITKEELVQTIENKVQSEEKIKEKIGKQPEETEKEIKIKELKEAIENAQKILEENKVKREAILKRLAELDEIKKSRKTESKENIESFDTKYIENKIRELLEPVKEIRIKELSIKGSGERLGLNAKLKVKKIFNVKLENIFIINKDDGIELEENYLSKIDAKEIIKEKIAEYTDSIGIRLIEFIEKEKNRIVEKIWIEDDQLKAKYKK